MARKISLSQFKNQMRQAQQKHKRAVDQVNREIRKHNQQVKQAVHKQNQAIRKHNSAVRTHNSRVRANRDRLRRELLKLSHQQTSPSYVQYRTTVNTIQNAYESLEHRANTSGYDDRYNELLDLSENEAANNVSIMNILSGDTPTENIQTDEDDAQWVVDFLKRISAELVDRWKGAIFSLNSENPDAARHFCTSAREIFTEILDSKAPDEVVFASLPGCEKTPNGNPTRKSKIRYFLKSSGFVDDKLEDFIEEDIKGVVQLFDVFNKGTHGNAGKFTHVQLLAIRKRVEDGIAFLSKIVV